MFKYLTIFVLTFSAAALSAQESETDKYAKENFEIVDMDEKASANDWYVTYRIDATTFAILAPHHWQETVSFLMIGDEKALLIDTGMGFGNIKHTVDALTDKPVIVVNSHSHYDHVSNNHHFDTVYGRDLEYTRKNASGHPKTTWQNALQPSAVSGPLPEGFSFENYESKGFEIDHHLKDGEVIDLGNREIEVIFTPGHTPDGMLFFDRDRGYLSTGDTFYPSTLWAHRADANLADYRVTAEKMAAMEKDVTYILPGHGEIVANPNLLGKLHEGLQQIGKAHVVFSRNMEQKYRRYEFDGFAILVPDPPE